MNSEISESSLSELQLLKQQVQSAIEMEQSGLMNKTTEREMQEHVRRYGVGTFLIGNFLIKKV